MRAPPTFKGYYTPVTSSHGTPSDNSTFGYTSKPHVTYTDLYDTALTPISEQEEYTAKDSTSKQKSSELSEKTNFILGRENCRYFLPKNLTSGQYSGIGTPTEIRGRRPCANGSCVACQTLSSFQAEPPKISRTRLSNPDLTPNT